MKSIYKKTILTVAIAASAFLSVGQVFAQLNTTSSGCDSTCGNNTGNWRAIIPLYAQEQQAIPEPIVNHIYPITRAAPNTYLRTGSGAGDNSAAASASCDAGDIMLSGGVTCDRFGGGLVAVAVSQPNGQGWYGVCGDYFERGGVTANTYVTCASQN